MTYRTVSIQKGSFGPDSVHFQNWVNHSVTTTVDITVTTTVTITVTTTVKSYKYAV